MSSAESRDDVIRLMEVILTAEVFNRTPVWTWTTLPPGTGASSSQGPRHPR